MALPVLIGPNRCELIYDHDKQPLRDLSLRVSLPVVELLHMLSQLAPPAQAQAVKPQRSPTKGPSSCAGHKDPVSSKAGKTTMSQVSLPQGSCSSNWHPHMANGSRTSSKLGSLARCPRETGTESGPRVIPRLKSRRNCYGPCRTKRCQGVVRHLQVNPRQVSQSGSDRIKNLSSIRPLHKPRVRSSPL